MKPYNLYVVEPQPVTMRGLESIVKETFEFELVGHSTDFEVALPFLLTSAPDLFLFAQPEISRSTLSALTKLRESQAHCSTILWITNMNEDDASRGVQMGARGVARKTLPLHTLMDCLRGVANGQIWAENAQSAASNHTHHAIATRISPREKQVIELVCRGMRNREIAAALSIAEGTVKVHLLHIFEKTGVTDRFQLAIYGSRILRDTPERPELQFLGLV